MLYISYTATHCKFTSHHRVLCRVLCHLTWNVFCHGGHHFLSHNTLPLYWPSVSHLSLSSGSGTTKRSQSLKKSSTHLHIQAVAQSLRYLKQRFHRTKSVPHKVSRKLEQKKVYDMFCHVAMFFCFLIMHIMFSGLQHKGRQLSLQFR